jgi:hypothetical protein
LLDQKRRQRAAEALGYALWGRLGLRGKLDMPGGIRRLFGDERRNPPLSGTLPEDRRSDGALEEIPHEQFDCDLSGRKGRPALEGGEGPGGNARSNRKVSEDARRQTGHAGQVQHGLDQSKHLGDWVELREAGALVGQDEGQLSSDAGPALGEHGHDGLTGEWEVATDIAEFGGEDDWTVGGDFAAQKL